jgi:O-methyltransferase
MTMRTVYERRPKIEDLPNRKRGNFPDLENETQFWDLYDAAKKYSMVHITGFFNVYSAIRYVVASGIYGDFVECGVWLGGVSIFAAKLLEQLRQNQRIVHLYDTFTGFPPGEVDKMLGKEVKGPFYKSFRAGVEQNLIDEAVKQYRIVEGPVETTLIKHPLPEKIAVLRLDTDFYNSTKAELQHLYPRLAIGGVLIVDDYGYYEGSRRACDEFFSDRIMWNRIDPGIRCGIKMS